MARLGNKNEGLGRNMLVRGRREVYWGRREDYVGRREEGRVFGKNIGAGRDMKEKVRRKG